MYVPRFLYPFICHWTSRLLLCPDSLEKTLMLGGIGGKRRRGWQRMRWLDGITDSMDVESQWTPGVGDGQGGLVCCDSWGRKESDTTEQLIWSDLTCTYMGKHALLNLPLLQWKSKVRLTYLNNSGLKPKQIQVLKIMPPTFLFYFTLLVVFDLFAT